MHATMWRMSSTFKRVVSPVWGGLEDQLPVKWRQRLAQFRCEGRKADADELPSEFRNALPMIPMEYADMSDEIVSHALPDPEPVPPREPDAIECCGSGCIPCVYDLYWERVASYEAELEAWQARHGKQTTND